SNYFFFQAEDGIRDKLVTGVQTCALPICRVRPHRVGKDRPGRRARRDRLRRSRLPPPAHPLHRRLPLQRRGHLPRPHARRREGRSEERRVGKEGRWGRTVEWRRKIKSKIT